MQYPVQVTFHGIEHSDSVESRILEKVAKLEQFYADIIGARVTVEKHHRNQSFDNRKGEPYHVSIELSVPGDKLVVRRDPKDTSLHDHDDISLAVRDAFQAMGRQLKDYATKRRGADRTAIAAGEA